jgi:hypothetical protein
MLNQLIRVMAAIVLGVTGCSAWETVESSVLPFLTNRPTTTVLQFNHRTVPYENYEDLLTLQSWIDYHPSRAGTCPFQVPQDNNDGKSSYFAGHDNRFAGGCFEPLKHMAIGAPITVMDLSGTKKTYHIVRKFDGLDDIKRWTQEQRQQVFHSEREQIVLQTCMSETKNLIIIAR